MLSFGAAMVLALVLVLRNGLAGVTVMVKWWRTVPAKVT